MSVLSTTRRRVAAGVLVGAVAVTGGSVAAYGLSGAGSTTATAGSTPAAVVASTSSTSPRTAKHAHPRALLARSDHATIELRRHGRWVTVELDRGKVTAVSPTSISLLRPDGVTVTLRVDAATKVHGVASESAIAVGRRAGVISENGTALRINQRPATAASTAATA
jgi:hypothetical protein